MSSTTRSPKIERDRTACAPMSSWISRRVTSKQLEPIAEPIGEKAHDPEATIEEIGDREGERKGERRFGAALVAEPPAAPRAFPHRFRVAQQRLHGDGRGGSLGHDFERQHPFLVAERHEANRQALMIGQARLVGAARLSPPRFPPRKAQERW